MGGAVDKRASGMQQASDRLRESGMQEGEWLVSKWVGEWRAGGRAVARRAGERQLGWQTSSPRNK